jgi:hypothetical protein
MVEAIGKDRRDWVKLKALFFLSVMRRVEGDSVFLSAGQIAQGANISYPSIRVLLKRWCYSDWVWQGKDKTGKPIKEVRHGYRYVEEYNVGQLGKGVGFVHGYRIRRGGLSYLRRAEKWHPCWQMAKDEVTRQNASIFTWVDLKAHAKFFVRPPFQPEDFGMVDDKKLDRSYVFCPNGEEALQQVAKLPNPPSTAFISYVRAEVLRRREAIRQQDAANQPPQSPAEVSAGVRP